MKSKHYKSRVIKSFPAQSACKSIYMYAIDTRRGAPSMTSMKMEGTLIKCLLFKKSQVNQFLIIYSKTKKGCDYSVYIYEYKKSQMK